MTEPELKPCPFCGNTPREVVDATRILGVWRVIHRHCIVPNFSVDRATRADAIGSWNTRADLPPTLAQALALPEVAALVEALRAIAETSNYTRASWMQDTARTALAALTTAPADGDKA